MFLSRSIPNLLGGVSQRPPQSRRVNEGSEQSNALSSSKYGLGKRPHSTWLGSLGAFDNNAYAHPIDRSPSQRFIAVMVDGDLKVFDLINKSEATVTFPDGKTYLNTESPESDLRAVTVDNKTIIVNRTVAPEKGTPLAAARVPEALVFIRQADFSTTYTVQINSTSIPFETVAGTSPELRNDISTDSIAANLVARMEASDSLTPFTFERFGSSIYITRTDGADFAISGKDGLADGGMLVIKGSVQDFATLPPYAKNGFTVEVVGEPGTPFDNYWLQYDDQNRPSQAGVWKEVVKPGLILGFDAATMPHELVFEGAGANGTANGAPALPTIYLGGGLHTGDGWATSQGGSEGTGDEIVNLGAADANGDTQFRYSRLSALPPETPVEVRMNYDFIISAAPTGHSNPSGYVLVHRKSNDDPDWILVAQSENYVGKGKRLHAGLIFNVSGLHTTTDIRVSFVMHGVNRSDPNAAQLVLYGPNHLDPGSIYGDGPSPRYPSSPAKLVQFSDDEKYPAGFDFTLTVGATTNTYTAVDGDTGFDVAQALATTIDGQTDYVATYSAGLITITKTDGTTPAVTYSTTFDETVSIFDPNRTFVADALIGSTITNETIGGDVTVTDNDAHVITFSGGIRFKRGDRYQQQGAANTFVFRQREWKDREAGDDTTNPFPSFTQDKINDVFFYKARLGFLSGNRAIMSEAGDTLNFFRQSAKDIFDDDLIDIEDAHGNFADFHSAVLWNKGMYFVSSNGWVVLTGAPLTPASAGLDVVGRFNSSNRVRPVVLGNSVQVAVESDGFLQIWEQFFTDQGTTLAGIALTDHSPRYIAGNVRQIVGDATEGLTFVLTDSDAHTLFVYQWHDEGDTRVVNSISKWPFAHMASIKGMTILDHTLYIVYCDNAGTMHFDALDVTKLQEANGSNIINLDHRFVAEDGDFSPGETIVGTDLFVETDNTLLTAHTPDLGFVGYEMSHADTTVIQFNSVTNETWGEPVIRGEGDLADDSYEAAINFFRGATDDTQQGGVLWFNFSDHVVDMAWTLFLNPEGLAWRWIRKTDMTVDLYVERYGSAGSNIPVESILVASGVDFPVSTSLRLGVTVNSPTVDLWTADADGSNRVSRGTYTIPNPELWLDGHHKRFGFGLMGVDFGHFVAGASRSFASSLQVIHVQPSLDETHYDLPYQLATDGTEGVLAAWKVETGELLTVTRPTDTTFTVSGDQTSATIWAGIIYDFSFSPTTIYQRDQNGAALTTGKLTIGFVDFILSNTTSIRCVVSPTGRPSSVRVFAADDPSDGVLHVSILTMNEYAGLRLHDSSPGQCWVTGANWEGNRTTTRFTRGGTTKPSGGGIL